ncbi:MAG: DUF4230 domain-containing protein [Treponema sp.]|jgi:hypothetical protein|nr:DUF4230 domain-containing protein [Treponema sp.]
MKVFLKIVLVIIIIFILFFIAQILFPDTVGMLTNYVKLKMTSTTVGGDPAYIPVFQIVSLEVFYPGNIALAKVDVRRILGLEFGTITLIYEYDFYLKYGVYDPKTIKIERINDTIFVDESTINIELLDPPRINNYKHIETYSSGTARPNMPDNLLAEAWNNLERELEEKMRKNGQANFDYAKKNFMLNYENMINAMGLQVVWR